MKPEIRFPTIIGIVFLIIALIGGVYLTTTRITLFSRASVDCQPINPQVSNITASSFNLFFTTNTTCQASINVNGQSVLDQQRSELGILHYYQVDNLEPKTNYTFTIVSGGKTYENNAYKLATASKPTGNAPVSNLAWGKVFNQNRSPAAGSVVFLNLPGGSLTSAIVTSSGNWSIPLSTSFDSNLSTWLNIPSDTEEEIIVFSPEGKTTILTGNTNNNNPMSDIILGQNYFDVLPNPTIQLGKVPSMGITGTVSELTIINPDNGENLSTQRPDFFGTAPKGSMVTIKVESPITLSGQVTPGSDGSWNWSPPEDLAPGEHTITISAPDPISGIIKTVQRKFIVLASDDSLAFSASASATMLTPSPSLAPTSTPTAIPTQRTSKPSTDSGIPVTGNGLPSVILLVLATVSVAFSLLFIKKDSNFN